MSDLRALLITFVIAVAIGAAASFFADLATGALLASIFAASTAVSYLYFRSGGSDRPYNEDAINDKEGVAAALEDLREGRVTFHKSTDALMAYLAELDRDEDTGGGSR